MTYYLSLIFITAVFLGCASRITWRSDVIKPNEHYPRWLKNESYRTDQTSGITFITENENGGDEFLLIDDIGKLHRLQILNDTIFTFTKINFSENVQDYLNKFPKIDFEEIAYDKFTGEVYITIEGNGPDYLKYNGIYRLDFKDKNIESNFVVSLEKIEIYPKEIFIKYVKENIGYEGLAVSKNYLFLGLEGILNADKSFSGNSLVLVVSKFDLQIVKEIYTKEYNIVSICGLYAESDSFVWGIDRNNRTLFNLNFDDSKNIKSCKLTKLKTVIPFYNHFEYTASLESLTMSDRKNIFLVDDPWHSRFVPDSAILERLDTTTVKNFTEFVPIIHKLNLE